MKLFLFFAFLFFASSGFSWSEKVISFWDQTNLTHSTYINSSTFGTFWGGVRRGLHWRTHKGNMIDVDPEGFFKSIPIYLQFNQRKRDLFIFYPGVFGKPDGVISPTVIDDLEKKDAHVVAIPNLLAAPYVIGRPDSGKDPFAAEEENQRKIILEVIKKIGIKNIRKIHVIGESLGSLQALSAFSPKNNIKMDSLTLLWPALNMKKAVDRFDLLINKSISLQNNCSYWWRWPKVLLETKLESVPSGLNQEDKNCLGYWVIASGFVKSIKDNAEAILSKKNMDTKSLPSTFRGFIDLITPEIIPFFNNNDSRLTIESRLDDYRGLEDKIRIVSSSDDFLNTSDEWDSLRKRHPKLSSQIYLFSWGGHSGPLGLDGFFDPLY